MIRSFATAAALCAMVAAGPAHALDPLKLASQSGTQDQAEADTQASSGGNKLLGGIFGCSASGNKQGLAAVIGGAAGAFLGNRIAGRGNRTIGTLIGGALGAAAGSAIGCKLQKTDRAKAERAAQAALETGQSQSWSNPETGASGTMQVTNAQDGPTLGGLKFASGVEPATGYASVMDSYTTTTAANIRSGPGTASAIRGTLPAGQRIWVPAKVSGQPWMLIAENGVGQGYVYSSLLRKTSEVAAANCKLVTQTVSLPGETTQAETYQACKGSDGQWTMTKV